MASLRGDDGFVTIREILQGAPEDLLAGALRVGVRRVEEVDAGFDRLADQGPALVLRLRPGGVATARLSEGHAPEGDRGNVEAGVAAFYVAHRRPSSRVELPGMMCAH